MSWTLEVSGEVPLVAKGKATAQTKISLGVGTTSTTTNTQVFTREHKLTVAPKTRKLAEATYSKGTITLEAILTVETKYKNGCIQVFKRPATYTGVSAFDANVQETNLPPDEEDTTAKRKRGTSRDSFLRG